MTVPIDQARQSLSEHRAALMQSVHVRSGLEWCAELSDATDRLVEAAFFAAVEGEIPHVSVLASGGYGRRELSPYSDIDVTLLTMEEGDAAAEKAMRRFFLILGDQLRTLGLVLGPRYEVAAEAAGMDAEARSSLLDARLLVGDAAPLASVQASIWTGDLTAEFLLSKIKERQRAWAKTNDTPLVVEPDLKEGAGGLRSFHAANWIRMAIGERRVAADAHYDAILGIRNSLHAAAAARQDRLTRPRQAEIADARGQDMYQMMSGVANSLTALHRQYEEAIARMEEARFGLAEGVEFVRGEARIVPGADAGAAAVGIGLASQLGLRIAEFPPACRKEVSGATALYAISLGEPVLRSLDRAGLWPFLLPELEACRTLFPRDSAHTYTVYEHTLRAIRHLDQAPADSFYGHLKQGLTDPARLCLALLLHDAGKAVGGRPHSETGAEIASKVARRWGLASALEADVVWLVANHLVMERFLSTRDLDQPQTIADFAEVVGSEDRLAMLTLLTWADVHAVAPDLWTPTHEVFLKTLYDRTQSHLKSQEGVPLEPAHYRRRLQVGAGQEVEPEKLSSFLAGMPIHYLAAVSPALVTLHYRYCLEARLGTPTVEIYHLEDHKASEVTVCAVDRPGLLSEILGVIYAHDLRVLAIRVSTSIGEPNVLLDSFTVSHVDRPIPDAAARRLSDDLRAVLMGRAESRSIMLERGKDPDRGQDDYKWDYLEGAGILEIQAPRGRGMAYRMASKFAGLGWNISTARVSQWANRATAAFYITKPDGSPVPSEEVHRELGRQV